MLDRTHIAAMFLGAAALMEAHADRLSEIDARFGDGDHGITIRKIARLLRERVPQWGEESIQDFLDGLGTAVMEVKGGSAGPLYGTMISGLGAALGPAETELDGEGVKRMFTGCLAEMADITDAKVGDKTMMDALIPAVEAAQAAQGGPAEILEAAAAAAEAGAKASEGFVSKYGRARSYKEKTIGTPDAGAVSTSLFFRGLAQGLSSI
ncbi:DAK2 domain-containing protein [uncultured Oscillibacter sp.]|uniref:DAK2 domain-containing protein n=1 Tax=uncultured Oscillibacter sp. TaxID=876091 RepID=UPI0025F1E959|nr:DAK2 domain-containing protein [uncultured Oscillibacter sp.]